jgi:type I restriction enzyme, S subunit
MRLAKYSEYKLIMIQWIREIPEHWNIYKIKHIKRDIKYSIVDGPFGTQLHSDEYLEKGIPVVRVTNLTYRGKFCSDNLVYISEKKYRTLKRSAIVSNDVIIAKTGATIGKVGVPNNIDKAIISSSCLKLSIRHDINPYFVKYLLISDSGQSQILSEAAGSTRDTINIEPFSNLFFPFPIKNEQNIIVNFLDKKIAEIDKLIKKDKKLIELLQERRTALINHVVTKGLNPNVRMKDSGIDWIGKAPEDWEVCRLKNRAEERKTKNNFKEKNDTIFIGLENIEGETGKLLSTSTTESIDGESYMFKKNNVLFGKLRPYLSKVIKVNFDGTCTGELIIFSSIRGTDPKYLFYRLISKSFIKLVDSMTYGVKMPRVSPYEIKNIKIVWPSLIEQQKIASYLDKQTSKIDKTIQKIQQKVNLLEEYKKSLIHHVVTGKVDVRSVKI